MEMKTYSFVDSEKENVVLSLLGQMGSAHDNLAFVQSIQAELINNDKTSSTIDKKKSPMISISFHQINYHISQKSRLRKQILHDITGGFSPGMNAILGKSIKFHQRIIVRFSRTIRLWKILSIGYSCRS